MAPDRLVIQLRPVAGDPVDQLVQPRRAFRDQRSDELARALVATMPDRRADDQVRLHEPDRRIAREREQPPQVAAQVVPLRRDRTRDVGDHLVERHQAVMRRERVPRHTQRPRLVPAEHAADRSVLTVPDLAGTLTGDPQPLTGGAERLRTAAHETGQRLDDRDLPIDVWQTGRLQDRPELLLHRGSGRARRVPLAIGDLVRPGQQTRHRPLPEPRRPGQPLGTLREHLAERVVTRGHDARGETPIAKEDPDRDRRQPERQLRRRGPRLDDLDRPPSSAPASATRPSTHRTISASERTPMPGRIASSPRRTPSRSPTYTYPLRMSAFDARRLNPTASSGRPARARGITSVRSTATSPYRLRPTSPTHRARRPAATVDCIQATTEGRDKQAIRGGYGRAAARPGTAPGPAAGGSADPYASGRSRADRPKRCARSSAPGEAR